MRKVLVVLGSVALAGCTDADGAVRAVAAQGLSDVQTTGYRFLGCSEDDVFRTGFEATTAAGHRVSGVVCSGWFKGSTVRFD